MATEGRYKDFLLYAHAAPHRNEWSVEAYFKGFTRKAGAAEFVGVYRWDVETDDDGDEQHVQRLAGLKGWDVAVAPEFRRQGLASAMYRFASETFGLPVEPGDFQTPDGEAFLAKRNPGGGVHSEKSGRRLYRTFHGKDPKKIEIIKGLKVPSHVFRVGEATQVLYRSDKLNPTTLKDEGVIDYFHDHEGGVKLHLADGYDDGMGKEVRVPAYVKADTLVVLGKCLGMSWESPDGEQHQGEGTNPLPELCAITPSGRALYIVQGRKQIICIIWGGNLRVRQEGIVG